MPFTDHTTVFLSDADPASVINSANSFLKHFQLALNATKTILQKTLRANHNKKYISHTDPLFKQCGILKLSGGGYAIYARLHI